MQPTPKQLLHLVVAGILCALPLSADEVERPNENEQLATVRSWLPFYHRDLELIFEYDASNERHESFDSILLHNTIDRVGPTVVIVEAYNAFEEEPRIVGGYNPYRWKNWLGRYEAEPGRFVFDLGKAQKWERETRKPKWVRKSPATFGLAFGDGDLVINPDLKTGSARNHTFASPSNTSVLMGQSGDFLVETIRIYRVADNEDEGAPPPSPFLADRHDPPARLPPPPPYRVPDRSLPLVEIGIGLSLLAAARFYTTCKRL